jgi:hypothetical protein
VKTDPIPNASFRVQEFPPDTTKRLVNLSDFYLDAASVSSSGSALTIRNLRALSAQSTFEDYFKGTFQFDFGKQRFELTSLLQITNLGVFATRGDYHYSAKDVPSAVTMTNALGAVYAMDTKHSGISTGQVLYMPLQSGQLVSFYFQNITGPFNFKVKDPFGNQTVNYYISAGAGFVYWLAIVGPESGVYQVQFVPATGSSISLTNSFLNGNRRAVTTLTNGTIINVSPAFRANFVDYAKFKVNLSQGQILTMPAGSSTLYFTAVNSRSRAVWEQATGGLAYFQAPATDTYYIFVDNHWAGSDITYSGTVSISP